MELNYSVAQNLTKRPEVSFRNCCQSKALLHLVAKSVLIMAVMGGFLAYSAESVAVGPSLIENDKAPFPRLRIYLTAFGMGLVEGNTKV